MFADKSWGTYRVLDVSDGSMTIKVTLDAGLHMNYHSHERRDEVWIVISGSGIAIVDGARCEIQVGDVISMPVGCRHTVTAVTRVEMIEAQIGKDISVHDKVKHELGGRVSRYNASLQSIDSAQVISRASPA